MSAIIDMRAWRAQHLAWDESGSCAHVAGGHFLILRRSRPLSFMAAFAPSGDPWRIFGASWATRAEAQAAAERAFRQGLHLPRSDDDLVEVMP
jgi:hypothetical protein